MPAPDWSGRPGYFPRLTWNSNVLDIQNPVDVNIPTVLSIRGENYSMNGFRELLHVRDEVQVTLGFKVLSTALVTALHTYYDQWGKLGEQSTLVLDRNATQAGQWEYDFYNTYFTRAELLTTPFAPGRMIKGGSIYLLELTFRQGALIA